MNKKDRNPWLAGVFTFFTIGLGHLYTGQAKKGVLLFLIGHIVGLVGALPLIYYFPTVPIFIAALFVGLVFLIYCIFDAVKLSKRYRYGYALKRYNKWYVYLGCLILSCLIIQPIETSSIKKFFMQAYRIPTISLEPTLLTGDLVLAKKKLAVKLGVQRGDMIIFPYPKDVSKDYMKRVVAMGGETIEIVNKEVFVNGHLLQEPYVIHSDHSIMPKGSRDNFGPETVPEDALFVLGDNRDQSNDSRFWGFVEKSAVKGKAYVIYWSWDKENFKVRWDRIGKIIE